MLSFSRLLFLVLSFSFCLSSTSVFASECGESKCKNRPPPCDKCCSEMGGVSYCDSSAGRIVCKNGSYSTCYCTRHAVMLLDHIQGCCIWQGGVLGVSENSNLIVCNDGSTSQICSDAALPQGIATW